jgi:uncharacterized protein (TIGR03032 family)
VRLDTEFIRLPLRFDVDRMQAEVDAIAESEWRPHPQGHPGNSALPLTAVAGDPLDDGVAGPMVPTPQLARCEYLQQVLASFETVIGRSRLMRLEGESEATLHSDTNYYWADRVRIHVPVRTDPAIEFVCNGKSVHMGAGEAWIFDAWQLHNVLNPTGGARIHLVADTVGSAAFWELVDRGERPFGKQHRGATPTTVVHRAGERPRLQTERANFPVVMHPSEQARLADAILDGVDRGRSDAAAERALRDCLATGVSEWRALWARYAADPEGWPAFERLRGGLEAELEPLTGRVWLRNEVDAVESVRQLLIRPALNPELAAPSAVPPAPARAPRVGAERVQRRSPTAHRFDRPIFVVGAPRSGTGLLFEALAHSPTVWSIGGESHGLIEGVPGMHPAARGFDSNRLTQTDATPVTAERLRAAFLKELRDRADQPLPPDVDGVRMLEKTPKNALRIPFLNAIFPRSLFIYLYREPREALSSMIDAWESGRFVTYPQLPGWDGAPWSLALTPEWRKLRGAALPEIVADQWSKVQTTLLNDLQRLAPERVCAIDYAGLIQDPAAVLAAVSEFAQIDLDKPPTPLPLSSTTLTPPDPEKWRRHEEVLAPVLARTELVAARARDLLARHDPRRDQSTTQRRQAQPSAVGSPAPAESPLRSVSTQSFAQVLDAIDSSLLISTYQTGRLICVRNVGGGLNTHFRGFETPMGISWDGSRLAVGTRAHIWEYRNVPDVCEKLEPAPIEHDACLIPRRSHCTGDISVHELAYADGELWAVATRFSCLATFDDEHSFVPRWRPSFISSLGPDDRCHLNGLAVDDERVRFVTALGESDVAGGWRARKADGGMLIDVESSEIVAGGLSMPHSPRWHRERLWLLESGEGSLATVDLDTGAVETVVALPGFTRGLALADSLAFVGLSQVREATTFGGLPLTGRLEERCCGVWIVDLDTARIIGFLRFEDVVQEIFDVALLPGLRFPEIAEHGSDAVNLTYRVPEVALFERA